MISAEGYAPMVLSFLLASEIVLIIAMLTVSSNACVTMMYSEMHAKQQANMLMESIKLFIIIIIVISTNNVGVLGGICDTVNEYCGSYSRNKIVLSASTMTASLRVKYSNQHYDAHEFFTSLVTGLLEKLSPE